MIIAAALPMAACASIDDPPAGQTPAPTMFPSVTPLHDQAPAGDTQDLAGVAPSLASTGTVSIHTPLGKRVWLAAKANLAATNAWLASRGEHFVAANPEDMPNPYWGLDPTANAYLFLDATQYNDSRWDLHTTPTIPKDGVHRQGPYAVLDLTVYGFKVDATGARVDITGDGVVDDADWTGLEVSTTLSGLSPLDTATMIAFEHVAFGARTEGASVAVDEVDAEGYPNRVRMGGPAHLTILEAGAGNPNRCAPEAVEWERCWYWEHIAGTLLTVYPAPQSLVREWNFVNTIPNWVKFDAATDTFAVGDQALAAQLQAISFAPLFWVRSRDFSASYDSNF